MQQRFFWESYFLKIYLCLFEIELSDTQSYTTTPTAMS